MKVLLVTLFLIKLLECLACTQLNGFKYSNLMFVFYLLSILNSYNYFATICIVSNE